MHFWSPQTVGKIVLASALFLVPSLALAAPATSTQPVATSSPQATASSTMIADVNISNAALLYQNGRTFKVTFIIHNGIGAQEGVRYGLGLSQDAQKYPDLIDQKVYPPVLALPAHSSKQVTVSYTAPQSVTGSFDLMVAARNQEGLPLAGGVIKRVSIPSSNGVSGIYINPIACFVTIGASTTPYALLEGVDIKQSDTLVLHCPVHNVSKTPWVVTPAYTTYYRTLYGQQVPQQGGDMHPFSIKGGATTTVSLALPKATTPQSYDVAVSFMSQGKTVSNTFPVHYVIDGSSATIQTLSLDKTAYKKGDTAVASFVWTPSADGFPGSRIGTTSPSATAYTISLTNSAGISCIASSTGQGTLSQFPGNPITQLSLPIVTQCTNPHLSLSLASQNGTVLANRVFTATSSATETRTVSAWFAVLIAVALLAIILLIIVLMRRYRISHASSMLPLLLVIFGVVGFLVTPGQAHAATFCSPGYHHYEYTPQTWTNCLYTYTAGPAVSNSGYQVNQNIQIVGNITTSECANEIGDPTWPTGGTPQIDYAQLYARPNWTGSNLLLAQGSPTAIPGADHGTWYYYGSPVNGSLNVRAPSTPGNYSFNFTGVGQYLVSQAHSMTVHGGRGGGSRTFTYYTASPSSSSGSGYWSFTVCGSNQTWNGSSCVTTIPSCPSGQYYNTTLRSCVSNLFGQSCTSGANVCGDTSTGIYNTSGVCTATTPSNTLCTCTSGPNACGMKTTGNLNAAGTACAANPPPNSACCSAGNFWNTAINACSPNCGANAQLNSSGNACVCKPGGFVPSGANSCACPQYTSKVGSVCQDNAPSVSFSASPTQVYRGGSSTVTWSTDPAVTPAAQTSCAPSAGSTGFSTGNKPNGTYKLTNLTSTTNLSITCTYKGQSNTANTTITVLQPSMTLTTTPDKVNSSGGTSSVSWSANNVTSCSLTKNGQNWAPSGAVLTPPKGSHAISGSASVTVTSNTTVTLTCNGSSVTKTIDVAGKYFNF